MIPPPGPVPDRAAAEAKAEFLLRLRARGIRDLAVLRAVEAVPRENFVPHRYADLAAKDVALPIACGQTMSEPFFVARMVEALTVKPQCRVLEIGAGSGYATAILARLSAEVLGLERYQGLAIEARLRLAALGLDNAAILWGDGLAVAAETGTFDRLLIHAVIDEMPEALGARLGPDAIVVHGRTAQPGEAGRQHLVRRQRDGSAGGPEAWRETILGPARLRPLEPGRSKIL